jgi:transcription initiation factor TFIID subunit TAF12
MVREQEMLLEELAQFVLMLDAAAAAAAPAGINAMHGAPASLHALLLGTTSSQLQQQQQQQQQQLLQQQGDASQQQQQAKSGDVVVLGQALRTWTVATVTDTIFPVSEGRLSTLSTMQVVPGMAFAFVCSLSSTI